MEDQFFLTPYFLDQPLPGLEAFVKEGWFVNHQTLPPGEAQGRMGVLHEALAVRTARALKAGKRPVSLAGDCCAAIGVAAGIQRAGAEFDLVWFDAHGDFNTWDTTPSGFLGGMPLAMIAGLGEQTMLETVGLRPWSLSRITLADARELDPGERDLVEGSGIRHLADPGRVLSERFDRPIYLHFDTDLINPQDAPAMNYPAPGGPRASDLDSVFTALAATGHIAAVSVSSWNPDLDPDGRSRDICLALLDRLLGR
jgi:arginase